MVWQVPKYLQPWFGSKSCGTSTAYGSLPYTPTLKSVSKFAFNISHLKGGALAALGETGRPIKGSFMIPPPPPFFCDTEPHNSDPYLPFMMGLGRIWRGINKVCGALKRVSLPQSAKRGREQKSHLDFQIESRSIHFLVEIISDITDQPNYELYNPWSCTSHF